MFNSTRTQLYITHTHTHAELSPALKFHYKECTRNNHYQLYITRCFSLKEIGWLEGSAVRRSLSCRVFGAGCVVELCDSRHSSHSPSPVSWLALCPSSMQAMLGCHRITGWLGLEGFQSHFPLSNPAFNISRDETATASLGNPLWDTQDRTGIEDWILWLFVMDWLCYLDSATMPGAP